MQAIPECLVDVTRLRLAILRVWTNGRAQLCHKPIDCHAAAVTVEFFKVAKTTGLGGATEHSDSHAVAVTVWLASVLTTLLHVRGVIPGNTRVVCFDADVRRISNAMICILTPSGGTRCLVVPVCSVKRYQSDGKDVVCVRAVCILCGGTGSRRKCTDAAELAELLPPGNVWVWALKGVAAYHGKPGTSVSKTVQAMWEKIVALKGADCEAGTVAAALWMAERIVKVMVESGVLSHEDIPEHILVQCKVDKPDEGEMDKFKAAINEEEKREKAAKAAKKEAAAAKAAATKAASKEAAARKAAAEEEAAEDAAAKRAAAAAKTGGDDSRSTGKGPGSDGQGDRTKRRRDVESEGAGLKKVSKRQSTEVTGDGAGLADSSRGTDTSSEAARRHKKAQESPADRTPAIVSPATPLLGELNVYVTGVQLKRSLACRYPCHGTFHVVCVVCFAT